MIVKIIATSNHIQEQMMNHLTVYFSEVTNLLLFCNQRPTLSLGEPSVAVVLRKVFSYVSCMYL